jgi:hypothetical protein
VRPAHSQKKASLQCYECQSEDRSARRPFKTRLAPLRMTETALGVPLRPNIVMLQEAQAELEARQRGPYLDVAGGSIPLLRIASNACGEARNPINRLERSISFEPVTTAAANT